MSGSDPSEAPGGEVGPPRIVQNEPLRYASERRDRYWLQEQDAPPHTVESRTTKMNEILERLERKQYEVDTQAVASALIERLLAGRVLASARAA